MQDFTGGGIHALPSKPTHTVGDEAIDERIRALVKDFGCGEKSAALVEEMVSTSLKLGREETTTMADLKLFNRSLKELRAATKIFAPYRSRRKIVVFGSARTSLTAPDSLLAEEFARRMVELNYMIITGGGDGIMGAAQKGAGRDNSFGLNIQLPFEQRANEWIDGDPKLINFNYFFTRKLNFVKETHAVALFPGGFGTMDEGFEVLTLMQTGKARIIPVVLVDRPGGSYWKFWLEFLNEHLLKLGLLSPSDFHLFHLVEGVEEAVAEVEQFYRVYRSYRWVGPKLVIRLQKALESEAVERLNEQFAHLRYTGEPMVQTGALEEEKNEPELANLPRLVFSPDQRNFGELRLVIDAINLTSREEIKNTPVPELAMKG